MKVVIVGGVAVGATAAARIRRLVLYLSGRDIFLMLTVVFLIILGM